MSLWNDLTLDYQSIFQIPEQTRLTFFKLIQKYLTSLPFKAVCLFRLSHYFWKHNNKLFAFILHHHLYFRLHADISPQANIAPGLRMPHPVGIVIGDSVEIGSNAYILQGATLGGDCGKRIDGHTQPILGDNCFVGTNAVILGPIILGDRVIVGAGSVVNKSFGDGFVLVGSPAKPLKN